MGIPEKTELSDVAQGTAFPAGMKVLIVDNSKACLRILSAMLKSCRYQVTECEQHKEALEVLRELKFDLVITNVTNTSKPDMDGLKLLQLVGLEMDLPVIMLSDDSSTGTIMKAIKHGARDYLTKPVRRRDVEFIWKHVAISRKNASLTDPESSGSLEKKNNNERLPRKSEDAISGEALRASRKKRREPTGEDDGELENGEESRKKERFNWNGQRHEQFVAAVNQLGVSHAVPKKILNVLNIPGLKREHVASHLQKYRMGLKKAEKEKQVQQAQHFNSPFGIRLNPMAGPTGSFSFQTLPPRPLTTWNNHITPPPFCTLPQMENSTNAPGFLSDPHEMLCQVVAPQQLPVRQTSLNPLLINQNYPLRNMQHGSNDASLTLNNSLMGIGSGTSQPPSFKGFNNNNYNGLSDTGFMQNSYPQGLLGMDRIESPSGNCEAILNPNSWDLDGQI